MENAVEALKMAFAVLFFVGALTISIITFSQARETSDILLYREDETNYYEYVEASQNKSRVVGVETIIPTLYRYYKENYTVRFKTGYLNEDGVLKTTGDLHIYTTQTNPKNWNTTYFNYDNRNDPDALKIYAFDLDDESKRHEPWGADVEDTKLNLDTFINGGELTFQTSSTNESVVKVKYDGFLNKYKDAKFVETLGEYASDEIVYVTDKDGNIQYDKNGMPIIDESSTDTSTIIEVDGEYISLLKPKKKRIITYTLISED